jgi:hypothetical protein
MASSEQHQQHLATMGVTPSLRSTEAQQLAFNQQFLRQQQNIHNQANCPQSTNHYAGIPSTHARTTEYNTGNMMQHQQKQVYYENVLDKDKVERVNLETGWKH